MTLLLDQDHEKNINNNIVKIYIEYIHLCSIGVAVGQIIIIISLLYIGHRGPIGNRYRNLSTYPYE